MILLMMVDTPEEKRKFVILYENYRYLMLKVAADILHDYQLAEDAVQEAFVRVAKHMENVGQPEETATKRYLITITKHAAIDLYRRRNRLQSREIYMDELPEETGQLTYMAAGCEGTYCTPRQFPSASCHREWFRSRGAPWKWQAPHPAPPAAADRAAPL